MKIAGLDKLTKTLDQASRAAREIDGELATLSFDPGDPSSVEAAIAEAKLGVDSRLGAWYAIPSSIRWRMGRKRVSSSKFSPRSRNTNCRTLPPIFPIPTASRMFFDAFATR